MTGTPYANGLLADGQPTTSVGAKPEIRLDADEERVLKEAVAAMVATGRPIFQRGGFLVRVLDEQTKLGGVVLPRGTPTIDILPHSMISMHLSSAADWRAWRNNRRGPGKWVAAHPPYRLVRQVADYGEWKDIRVLEGVVESPVMRPDGSVLDVPGYDGATGLLYLPNGRFDPVPKMPTQADAEAACEVLAEVVVNFPFAGPEHRSAWMAGLLTMFARFAFAGCAPLQLIEAPERGTGKSLAATIQGEIATGRPLPVTPQTSDGEEMRKRIMAIALGGVRVVLLDNLTKLGGPVMDAALTSTMWSDRILGVSAEKRMPLLVTWIATGNNVEFIGDAVRRINLVRLEPDCDQPDARTGFKHSPLVPWVRENRPRLVRAALTVLRAFVVAGRPKIDMPAWGSFEAWSDLIRASLIWAGQPDPYLSRAKLAEGDSAESSIGLFFTGLREVLRSHGSGSRFTLKAAEIARVLNDRSGEYHSLRTAVIDLTRVRSDKPLASKDLGYLLRRFRGKVRNGFRLCRTPPNEGGHLWYLEPVSGRSDDSDEESGGDGGDGGDGFGSLQTLSETIASTRDGWDEPAACPPSPPSAEEEEVSRDI
ncbi:MAG: hypothetical protein HY898_34520 [Deltaproteobacteria bacterium]|nr:hypothetical protein [Deltaproteobacteria bacterium]